MQRGKRFVSVKMKMYIFVATTVLVVALGTMIIAFSISSNQINSYYRQNASDNARNVASMMDGDYLARLREAAASDEFQALRERAEEEDNEEIIEEYLREHDLWDEYSDIRELLSNFLANLEGIEYLYVVAHGDQDAEYDMYLVDDDENPIYETGYYEERELELRGIDISQLPEPTISHGDWGWLCSDFKPVYDSEGNCVCIVGCDINMDEVMAERASFLVSLSVGAVIYTVIVVFGAMFFMNKVVVNSIREMTREMKRFNPSENKDYETAGVMELDIQTNDEISEIYNGIRAIQINIIDYLKEKAKSENEIKNKEQKIDKLSDENKKDALTGAGSKSAYIKKSADLSRKIAREGGSFAILMVDLNNLKNVNDEFGHEAGDIYIKGCCSMISEVFTNSQVYRIGGDEFVAILQGEDYENREALADKLRKNYAESFAQEDKEPWFRFSAAVGVADNSSADATVESVFKDADKAMYEDKAVFKQTYGVGR